MKRVTASEARKSWFRLLDEVVAGATIVIERGGRRILLRSEPLTQGEVPDYKEFIRVPDAGDADRWGWRWEGEEGEVVPETDADPDRTAHRDGLEDFGGAHRRTPDEA